MAFAEVCICMYCTLTAYTRLRLNAVYVSFAVETIYAFEVELLCSSPDAWQTKGGSS